MAREPRRAQKTLRRTPAAISKAAASAIQSPARHAKLDVEVNPARLLIPAPPNK